MWFLRTLFILSQLLLVQLLRDVVPQNIVHAFTVVVGPVAERCGALRTDGGRQVGLQNWHDSASKVVVKGRCRHDVDAYRCLDAGVECGLIV